MTALFLYVAAFTVSGGALALLVASPLLLAPTAGLALAPIAGMYVRRCSPQS